MISKCLLLCEGTNLHISQQMRHVYCNWFWIMLIIQKLIFTTPYLEYYNVLVQLCFIVVKICRHLKLLLKLLLYAGFSQGLPCTTCTLELVCCVKSWLLLLLCLEPVLMLPWSGLLYYHSVQPFRATARIFRCQVLPEFNNWCILSIGLFSHHSSSCSSSGFFCLR